MLCKLQGIHSPKSWKAILSHCCNCNTTTSNIPEELESVAVIMLIIPIVRTLIYLLMVQHCFQLKEPLKVTH